jgi:hypothetical protein
MPRFPWNTAGCPWQPGQADSPLALAGSRSDSHLLPLPIPNGRRRCSNDLAVVCQASFAKHAASRQRVVPDVSSRKGRDRLAQRAFCQCASLVPTWSPRAEWSRAYPHEDGHHSLVGEDRRRCRDHRLKAARDHLPENSEWARSITRLDWAKHRPASGDLQLLEKEICRSPSAHAEISLEIQNTCRLKCPSI